MINDWMREFLLGLLQHAAKVILPGRRFVRKIIQVLTSVKEINHYVKLEGRDTFRSTVVAQVPGQME